MGRKKRIVKLPEWFDMQKYDSAKELDITGWYYQFLLRHNLYVRTPEEDWGVSQTLNLIHQFGVIPLDNERFLDNNFSLYQLLQSSPRSDFSECSSVNSATVNEIASTLVQIPDVGPWQLCCLLQKHHEQQKENVKSITLDSDPYDKPPDWNRMTCHPLLTIDLKQPRERIVNDFKALLTKLRDDYFKELKRILDQNFKGNGRLNLNPNDWVFDSILPHIDLHFWQIQQGLKKEERIPESQLISLLFPDREISHDTYKNTIMQNYLKPIQSNFLNYFANMIRKGNEIPDDSKT